MNAANGNPDLTFSRIIETARAHYENLKADITNASNRIEHIRLTALAQEAYSLLTELELFEIGLVYTKVGLGPEDLERYMNMIAARRTSNESDIVLDLPEFKSPFTPPPAMQ